MTVKQKRRIEKAGGWLLVPAVVGVGVGWWAYDRVAFFLPGWTARKAVAATRAAKRAARVTATVESGEAT